MATAPLGLSEGQAGGQEQWIIRWKFIITLKLLMSPFIRSREARHLHQTTDFSMWLEEEYWFSVFLLFKLMKKVTSAIETDGTRSCLSSVFGTLTKTFLETSNIKQPLCLRVSLLRRSELKRRTLVLEKMEYVWPFICIKRLCLTFSLC